jgi:hypothetical protein
MENVQDDGFNWTRIIATLATIVLTSTALGWVLEQSIPNDGKESMRHPGECSFFLEAAAYR